MAKSKVSPSVAVIQDEEKPVPRPVLAEAIVKMSEAARELAASGLNEQAVVVLLAHKTKYSASVIKAVLLGLRDLRDTYCRS